MKRRTLLAASAGALGAIAGCLGDSGRSLPEPPGGDWRQRGHDRANTAATEHTVPPRGTPAWDEGELGRADPVVDDGTAFCVANDAIALDARTGEESWRTELPGTAEYAPALTETALFVAADGRLLALDRTDGDELWSVSLPRPADGALTVDPPLVTVPLAPRRGETGLVAHDIESGDRLWGDRTLAANATAMDDEAAYATGYRQDGDTGIARKLSRDDGSRLWETEIDSPDTAPVVADDALLVTGGGDLTAHALEDGARLRGLGPFGDRLDVPPATADGTAFLGTPSETVALSIDDGSVVWRRDAVVGDGISVGRDAVVVSAQSLPEASLAGIAVLERADGSVRWEHRIEGFDAIPTTAPVLAENAVYYGDNETTGLIALGDLPPEDS